MEYIVGYLLFLITFLVGYFLGQGKITGSSTKETIAEAMVQVKKKLDTSPVGRIKTPTARDMYLKEHPLEKEGMQAMSEDLKNKGL